MVKANSEGVPAGTGPTKPAEVPAPAPAPIPARAEPGSDPRLPWAGKPRAVDIACWAAITFSGLYQAGSATHGGGGVTGIPGRNVVRQVLADRRAQRWADRWRSRAGTRTGQAG